MLPQSGQDLHQAADDLKSQNKVTEEDCDKTDKAAGEKAKKALYAAQIAAQESLLRELVQTAGAFNAQIQTLSAELEKLTKTQEKANVEISSGLSGALGILIGLNSKEYPIDVRMEREFYKDFPLDTEDTEHFKEKLLALLHGLDAQSIRTVIVQLRRLRTIRESDDPFLAFYDSEEREHMRQVTESLYSNIFKLSDDCYLYHPYFLPVDHFEPGVFVDKLMLPELERPERLEEKDIIDAGAFIGDSALILSPLTKKNVYAFEPTQGNYELMRKTIDMNGLTNVVPVPMALGENTEKNLISLMGSASTMFENAYFRYEGKAEIQVTRLDDYVREHGLQVGLIKADVEGAESMMLKGAIETIKTQKPALLISIYHNSHDYFGIKPWLESLDLGYKFKIRHSVGGTVMTETVMIAEVC